MKIGRFETNNIYNEDCYKAIKDIPDKSVDLIITDPPYEITNGIHESGFLKNRNKLDTTTQIFDKKLDIGLKENILDEFIRVMKKINIYIYGVIKSNYFNT